jgi:hypothetical protein
VAPTPTQPSKISTGACSKITVALPPVGRETHPFHGIYRDSPGFRRCVSFRMKMVRSILLTEFSRLGLCSAPFTQQCFGHIGIGSLFLVYFSFWAALIILEEQNKISWRPEVLDAIFIVPGGLGLACERSLPLHVASDPFD